MKNTIQETLNSLATWRAERHLTVEGQREGLYANFLEEATEFFKTTDELEKIDAICDMCVVAGNTIDALDTNRSIIPEVVEILKEEATIYDKQPTLAVLAALSNLKSIEIMKIDKEINEDVDIEGTYQIFVYRVYLLLKGACEYLGYNFDLAMKETLSQIHSRKGYWDDEVKKFIKTTKKEDQYQAQYHKCKLGR